jgi:hypothetical protein
LTTQSCQTTKVLLNPLVGQTSGWADDSSATKTDTEDEAEDNSGYDEKENSVNAVVKTFNYTDLAMSLLSSGNEKFHLSKEEESLIQDSTINTKNYGRTKLGIETRFFDTFNNTGVLNCSHFWRLLKPKKLRNADFIWCYVVGKMSTNELS